MAGEHSATANAFVEGMVDTRCVSALARLVQMHEIDTVRQQAMTNLLRLFNVGDGKMLSVIEPLMQPSFDNNDDISLAGILQVLHAFVEAGMSDIQTSSSSRLLAGSGSPSDKVGNCGVLISSRVLPVLMQTNIVQHLARICQTHRQQRVRLKVKELMLIILQASKLRCSVRMPNNKQLSDLVRAVGGVLQIKDAEATQEAVCALQEITSNVLEGHLASTDPTHLSIFRDAIVEEKCVDGLVALHLNDHAWSSSPSSSSSSSWHLACTCLLILCELDKRVHFSRPASKQSPANDTAKSITSDPRVLKALSRAAQHEDRNMGAHVLRVVAKLLSSVTGSTEADAEWFSIIRNEISIAGSLDVFGEMTAHSDALLREQACAVMEMCVGSDGHLSDLIGRATDIGIAVALASTRVQHPETIAVIGITAIRNRLTSNDAAVARVLLELSNLSSLARAVLHANSIVHTGALEIMLLLVKSDTARSMFDSLKKLISQDVEMTDITLTIAVLKTIQKLIIERPEGTVFEQSAKHLKEGIGISLFTRLLHHSDSQVRSSAAANYLKRTPPI